MALNNFKCNHLMPLHFKGLKVVNRKDNSISRYIPLICDIVICVTSADSTCTLYKYTT